MQASIIKGIIGSFMAVGIFIASIATPLAIAEGTQSPIHTFGASVGMTAAS